MAIIIEKAKIYNTDIELSNVYGRFSFQAMPDGKEISVIMNYYQSKADYELSLAPTYENKIIGTNVKNSFRIVLKEEENQDVVVISNKIVEELTNLGFKATSDIVVDETI